MATAVKVRRDKIQRSGGLVSSCTAAGAKANSSIQEIMNHMGSTDGEWHKLRRCIATLDCGAVFLHRVPLLLYFSMYVNIHANQLIAMKQVKKEDWHVDLLLFSAFWSAYRFKKALQLLRIHPFIFIRCRPSGAVWVSVCCSRALKHQWTTCSTFWATAALILINRWMQTNHVKNI